MVLTDNWFKVRKYPLKHSILFISYTIQRPEEVIDSKTGLGNMISYTECIVKCPQNINSIDSLISFGRELDKEKYYTGRIIHAANLIKTNHIFQLQQIDKVIEKALREKYFEVYYQPIYSQKEKRFTCAEALLRLNDPEYGYISPEIFIPAAEKSGAIHKIDNFVLEEVCRFISRI